MGTIVVLVIVLAVVVLGGISLIRDSSGSRIPRKDRKELEKKHVALLRQKQVYKSALTKIASNESGLPSLDAMDALNTVNELELKELS